MNKVHPHWIQDPTKMYIEPDIQTSEVIKEKSLTLENSKENHKTISNNSISVNTSISQKTKSSLVEGLLGLSPNFIQNICNRMFSYFDKTDETHSIIYLSHGK